MLEWTGEPGKPSASRLIPISVFDGESYEPGGLYLARPEPLALDSGTEYVLQQAGISKGLFDVNSAQDMQGYWFGYGSWHPMAPPPKPHQLQRARIMPQVVDDGRPHFKNRSSSTPGTQSGSGPSSTSDSTKEAPMRPGPPCLATALRSFDIRGGKCPQLCAGRTGNRNPGGRPRPAAPELWKQRPHRREI